MTTENRPPYSVTPAPRGAYARFPYGAANYVDEVNVQRSEDGSTVTIGLLIDLDTSDPDATPEGGFAELTIPAAAWDALTAAVTR